MDVSHVMQVIWEKHYYNVVGQSAGVKIPGPLEHCIDVVTRRVDTDVVW